MHRNKPVSCDELRENNIVNYNCTLATGYVINVPSSIEI